MMTNEPPQGCAAPQLPRLLRMIRPGLTGRGLLLQRDCSRRRRGLFEPYTRIEGAASRGAATEAEQSKYRLRVREPPRRGREGAGSGCGASKLARCRKGVARASQGRRRGASRAPQGCRHVPQGSRGSRGWKGGALPQWCGVDEVRKRSAHACRRCRRMGCGQAPGPEQGATTLSCAIVMRCGEVCGRPTGVMLQIAA